MKNNLLFSPSIKSKASLYKPFVFYTLSSFLPTVPSTNNMGAGSFKTAILSQLPITDKVDQQGFLVRAQVLSLNNSFLYLDLGKKYTLVKPKFKSISVNLVSKEFLFIAHKTFFKCLTCFETNKLVRTVQLFSLKISEFISSGSGRVSSFSYFKKLIYFSAKYSYKFFFFKESIHLFSTFQKKINFFQFNILFKKYKYIYNK
jgi:hypothetical protein